MKRLLIALAIVCIFVGCGTAPTKPQLVEVPIITKCSPITEVKDIDVYPVDEAKKEMSLYDKFKLALRELELVKDQNLELKAALNECTK